MKVNVLARGDRDTVNLGWDESPLAQRVNHHYLQPVAHGMQHTGLHHVATVDCDLYYDVAANPLWEGPAQPASGQYAHRARRQIRWRANLKCIRAFPA